MSPQTYRDVHARSCAQPEEFWGEAASGITWIRKPATVLDSSAAPLYRWFPDGVLNTCYNALDRHVIAGHADRTAVVYESPVTGVSASYTFAELLDLVGRCAGVLRALGVGKGDRVVIYMPMIPETVVTMLACARLGAIHSVVFGGFAPGELAARIDDAQPTVIVAASCGIEPTRTVAYKPMLDEALERSTHQPAACLMVQRPQLAAQMGERDMDWATLMKPGAVAPAECVAVQATDPLYILYTSGTTGRPKGIVRDNGGHAVALAWSMPNLFGIRSGDVWWAASDLGWAVGHSYTVYGPLLVGATTVLFEGKPVGTPDAATFWRLVAKHRVNGLFAAPTAFRAIKKEDPDAHLAQGFDLSSLRRLFMAGERLDPDTYQWATEHLERPVIDNWWQTETGWPMATSPVGIEELPLKPGSASVPSPGYNIQVLDDSGQPVGPNIEGSICVKLPLPPGTLPTLWGDDDRYIASYLSIFDGYFLTGDGGYLDDDGYLFVMGRTDDVLNVAGHRLSTGSIEAALAGHPSVAECAVIGVHDELKGQVPRALVVVKSGIEITTAEAQAQLCRELVQRVRAEVGPVAALKQVDVVAALPKTRSGKILRKAMRQMADGQVAQVPSTIEDPAVLEALAGVLTGHTA